MSGSPRDEPLPSVAVVIPVYGDLGSETELLCALDAQSYPRALFEVVVVDNNVVRTITLDHPGVRVIHEPRAGSYAARNAGMAGTHAEVMAFTDADCRPHPEWLREGIAALLGKERVIVGGRINVIAGDPPSVAELLEVAYSLDQERYVREGYAATANLFIRRIDLLHLGGFDERLFSGGDRDLGLRATAAGLSYEYANGAVIDHRARTSVRALLGKTRRVTRGSLAVARKHGGLRGALRRILINARPPARRVAVLACSSNLPVGGRVVLVAVSIAEWTVGLWTMLRAVLPGSPPPPRA